MQKVLSDTKVTEDACVRQNRMKEKSETEIECRRRKILIVEDNKLERKILGDFLKEDYEIEEACDGEEAYNILASQYKEISIVILDLFMPNCDGLEFLKRINDNPLLMNVPIIVLTGSLDSIKEKECLLLGAIEFLNKPVEKDILQARLRNIIKMREKTFSLNAIEFDDLTGVYTKQAFFYHAKELLDKNEDVAYDVIISDIENFSLVNAVYGMKKGDELLKSFADYSEECCENGVCGRFGIDQIVCLYPTLSAKETDMFKNKFAEFKKLAPVQNIVIKYGIYQNVDRNLSISDMCDRAFLALKSIKHNHTRIYALYDGPLSQHQFKSRVYESRFQEAIENNEFVVWYQPKYDSNTKKVVGAEALVRWKTADGMIPPGEFLEIFETDGLIWQLDEYVFRSVCEYQKYRKEMGYEQIPISVNLSRGSLFGNDVVGRYKTIADEYGIEPKYVPIEITESTAIVSRRIKAIADEFYDAGFCWHMDDFGSGQSSLNGLNVLRFDVVKLDKSLIDYIGDRNGELILKYTMVLAKELGLCLVAEGVENETQFRFLKENNCDSIQGYYFSKPLPPEEFEQKLKEHYDYVEQNQTSKKKYVLLSEEEIDNHAMVRANQCMPGGFFTYKADEDRKILSSNRYVWNMFGCDTEEEFMEHVGGSFKGMVYPEELERVQQSIDNQVRDSGKKMDFVKYNIRRKDGTKLPIVDYGHLVEQDGINVFYVFISEAE